MLLLKNGDPLFPESLRKIPEPPKRLWVSGDPALLSEGVRIAIVGARKATPYGRTAACQFAKRLAESGLIVVSGLASGIDAAAHEGALAGGGKTIAVLGCGVDYPYPQENLGLKERIIVSGAVVSEFPPETSPLSWNFPRRNRIISGLSRGVLVVEAGEKSGALVTVDWALRQGIEVFAVPGNITSAASVGTNRLIQTGANPVLSVEDLMTQMNLPLLPSTPKREKTPSKILALLEGGAKAIDELVEASGLPVQEVNTILTTLEMEGQVRGRAGGQFERVYG